MMCKGLLIFFVNLVFANCASFKQGFVSPKTCETKECIDAAEHIKKWMNPDFKPCEDFYEFSCGYWHSPDNQTINKQHTSSMGSKGGLFDVHLKTFLKNETVEQESNLFQMAKQFINMCLDGVSIEARGVAPAVQHLRAAGGWPVLEKIWCEKHWDFLRAEMLFGGVFLKIGVEPTDLRMTQDLVILPGYVGDKYFGRLSQGFESEVVQERYKNLTELAELFGADKKKAEVDMRDSLQFEIDLSEFSEGVTSTMGTYRNMTELQNDITWLNWTQLITSLLPESMNIPDNVTVIILGRDYVKELGNFINKYPKRTIANYMMAKGAASLVKYLPTPVECPDDPSMPRYNICVEIVKSSSLSGILASYMARQMIEETRVATETTRSILNEMILEVNGLEWLDEETRSLALSKLKETKLFISFPDELLNIDTVEEIYKEVKINNSYFFEAVMDSEKWLKEEKFSKLGKSFSDITIIDKIDASLTLHAQFINYLNVIGTVTSCVCCTLFANVPSILQ